MVQLKSHVKFSSNKRPEDVTNKNNKNNHKCTHVGRQTDIIKKPQKTKLFIYHSPRTKTRRAMGTVMKAIKGGEFSSMCSPVFSKHNKVK